MMTPAKTIHRKTFAHGRMTPQEMHRMFAFPLDARCAGCGGRPHVRAITMVSIKDALAQGLVSQSEVTSADFLGKCMVPIQETKGTKPVPYIRLSNAYSCDRCRREFEKALAKLPSYMIVEINAGPEETNRVLVGVS